MAAVTRKRSAFSVFKATNPGKEKKIQSIEIESTPNLAEIGLSQYEEHKMAVKKKGRIRRGSLPDLNDQDKSEQENIIRTPRNPQRKPKRAQTCKSEPRLQSLRKSFKRKKREASHQNENNSGSKNNGESDSKVPRLDSVNSDESAKSPICQVQMPSSENLRSELGDNAKMALSCEEVLKWLIKPIDVNEFFRDVWEKKPLLIKRRQPAYNGGWFSTKELDCILREKPVKFGVNLDVTTYKDGKRETHNPPGRAYAPVVWDFYKQGCSVRVLNPQSFSETVWKLTSVLQEYFGVFVGANVYLTPPGSQGFAPHYDDIEAFVIQLEGQKQWKLYSPRSVTEALPRTSSENLSQDEIGEPILDKILEPGDCLYFPRGFIHQATTTGDSHSLHITLSVYQKNTWGDFLEKLLPQALRIAMEEDLDFRKGLPIGYLNHVGVSNSDKTSTERSDFLRRIQQLIMKLATYAPIDGAADQMAVDCYSDKLPPVLSEEELRCSIHGNGAFWDNGRVRGEAELATDAEVRIIRPNIARLAVEDSTAVVYHTMENSRIFREFHIEAVEISLEEAEAVEYLLNSYPNYVSIDSVPLKTNQNKLNLVKRLYSHGILRTRFPLVQDSAV